MKVSNKQSTVIIITITITPYNYASALFISVIILKAFQCGNFVNFVVLHEYNKKDTKGKKKTYPISVWDVCEMLCIAFWAEVNLLESAYSQVVIYSKLIA